MLVAACGIACEVCKLLRDEACEMCGCVPGPDERVPKKQQLILAELGFVCKVLDCASKKKLDYCFKCEEFPCEIFYTQGEYGQGFPFSRGFLERFKSEKDSSY